MATEREISMMVDRQRRSQIAKGDSGQQQPLIETVAMPRRTGPARNKKQRDESREDRGGHVEV